MWAESYEDCVTSSFKAMLTIFGQNAMEERMSYTGAFKLHISKNSGNKA